MLQEQSAGAIIFRKESGEILFLVLLYEEGHWGTSKGHVEKDETLEQTAIREIHEETGLIDISLIPGFQAENHYTYKKEGQLSNKSVIYFLAQTRTRDIKLSDEHLDYAWLPNNDAQTKVTFKNEREVYNLAYQHLIKTHKR